MPIIMNDMESIQSVSFTWNTCAYHSWRMKIEHVWNKVTVYLLYDQYVIEFEN